MPIFERTTPESMGIPSNCIQQFLTQLKETCPDQETHHFMMLRHGKVISEGSYAPYKAGNRHVLYSVSKAFTSTAIGFLVAEGKLKVTDNMLDYFPEYREFAAPGMEQLTVHQVLAMTTGQNKKTGVHVVSKQAEEGGRLEKFFAFPSEDAGQFFRYDGDASYSLSRLVTKISGQHLDEFLKERLFDKLGIRMPFFERCPEGYCLGASGMKISIEEMAALGQFYLQKGNWKGEQILPAEWIEQASSCQIDTSHVVTGTDWNQGYCYHFWRGRHNTYRFCGAYGQMCVIMPDLDALFLVQSAFENSKLFHILDTFYETILPYIGKEPLPENEKEQNELNKFIKTLALSKNHKPTEEWELSE
ncbi:MAG: serine hydrolase [Ruminococcaceae bacterium]|nr:serine hydrolase [Oscillospiraceae bacterium]